MFAVEIRFCILVARRGITLFYHQLYFFLGSSGNMDAKIPGLVLLGILGGGSQNPDPISHRKISFSSLVFRPGL